MSAGARQAAERPLFTVVMPAYQSAGIIETALRSVRAQDIPQEQVEILVLDGGSTDETVKLAEKYGAVVLQNPRRLPEFAKQLGYLAAHGRYGIMLDTDEELVDVGQLRARAAFLAANPGVHCLLCDRLLPDRSRGVASAYLNAYGDPFSFFVYRLKGGILRTFSRHRAGEKCGGTVLRFQQGDLLPIGDGGATLVDLDFVREAFPGELEDIGFCNRIAGELIGATGLCGVLNGDDVIHHSAATLRTYLAKLRFRVINNLFSRQESGFSARAARNGALVQRKRLFFLYALTVVGPLFDSLRLGFRHRDASMLLHVFYLYYVCGFAAVCMVRSLLGKRTVNRSYAK